MSLTRIVTGTVFPRVLPFAIFMAFIGAGELARFLGNSGFMQFEETTLYLLYPIKALLVGIVLLLFRSRFPEIKLRDLANPQQTAVSTAVGLVVFLLWVNMDWSFGTQGTLQGFNPTLFNDGLARMGIIAFRLAGAVIVVPFMEELFWRSFLIRYIINSDIEKVPIGLFTWSSFLISTVLFGLEHNLFLAGIMAGIAYNLLLYRTRSLAHCIFAHAVTNLLLGIYVLATGKWQFW
jgi:hypothetical protein